MVSDERVDDGLWYFGEGLVFEFEFFGDVHPRHPPGVDLAVASGRHYGFDVDRRRFTSSIAYAAARSVSAVEQHEVHEQFPAGPLQIRREVVEGVYRVETYITGTVSGADLVVPIGSARSSLGFARDKIPEAESACEDAEDVWRALEEEADVGLYIEQVAEDHDDHFELSDVGFGCD